MNHLISAITQAKKNLIAPQRLSVDERLNLVNSIFKIPKQAPMDLKGHPTGVIVALIPDIAAENHLHEFLPPAILSGNTVILVSNSEAPWTKDLEAFSQEGLIQVVTTSNIEEIEILTSHPAVNAVYGSGSSQVFQNLMLNKSFQTKKHFWRGSSSNSFLILADANLNEALECFWSSVTYEKGLHPTATKKLLILEAHLPDFKHWLEHKKSEIDNSLPSILNQVRSEGGKILLQGSPTIVLDLPHCSELQQNEMNHPLALVSTVKYAHEMVKWNNTGQYAMSAVIFGSDEKAKSLAQKLDVGSVWINRHYNPKIDPLPIGNKLSHFGFKDLSPSGDFFLDKKTIF